MKQHIESSCLMICTNKVRSHDPATRKVLTEKVLQYKKSLSSQRVDYDRAKEQATRSSLLGTKSIEQRQRLLDTTEKFDFRYFYQ